jgi:hypothetical protein
MVYAAVNICGVKDVVYAIFSRSVKFAPVRCRGIERAWDFEGFGCGGASSFGFGAENIAWSLWIASLRDGKCCSA